MKRFLALLFVVPFIWPGLCLAEPMLAEKLSGRILLQVEDNGEAWYVSPANYTRYFLGRPDDAFELMRNQGIGITNNNLAKIKPALENLGGPDTDDDGLPDSFEVALGIDKNKKDSDGDGHSDWEEISAGYNPAGDGALSIDNAFAAEQKGKIFLQTQRNGEAWYVSPTDNLRYYLGRPADAFAVMRALGLGISNIDLGKIKSVYETEKNENTASGVFDLSAMEKTIHLLINNERKAYGLAVLTWNDDLAAVARAHSASLAKENETITDANLICDYPIIHHEGLSEGFNVSRRLENGDVYNFSKNGENIALVAGGIFMFLSGPGESNVVRVEECRKRLADWESDLKEQLEMEDSEAVKISIILSEIQKRKDQIDKETLKKEDVTWKYPEEVTKEMIDGWMDSPGHRANILDLDFDQTGVGLAYVNGYVIGTQVFTKKVTCGYQEGACCDRGGCYLPLSCGDDNVCR